MSLAINYMTKGIAYSMPIFKYLMTEIEYVIIARPPGGGGAGGAGRYDVYGDSYDALQKDIKKIGAENIEAIKVYVKWRGKKKKKRIYVELIEKKIVADLMESYGNKAEHIRVQMVQDPKIVKRSISAQPIND